MILGFRNCKLELGKIKCALWAPNDVRHVFCDLRHVDDFHCVDMAQISGNTPRVVGRPECAFIFLSSRLRFLKAKIKHIPTSHLQASSDIIEYDRESRKDGDSPSEYVSRRNTETDGYAQRHLRSKM